MRTLSKSEIEIVNQFKQQGRCFSELLGRIGKELVIKTSKEKKQFEILINNFEEGRIVNSEELNDFLTPRLFFINTLIKLLDYLEYHGYLVTFSWNQEDEIKYFGNDKLITEIRENESNCIKYVIDNEELTNLILRFGYSFIRPTESLNQFIINGYLTPEQIRYRINKRITISAIALSFLVGVLSIWISTLSYKKPIRADERQFNQMIEKFDSVIINQKNQIQTIDSLKNIINKLDKK